MELKFLSMIFLLFLSFIFYVYFFSEDKRYSNRLPPGSMGLPLIGQSFEVMKAFRADKVEEWYRKNITKYGLIWKGNIFGHPTVVLHGTAANKFVFTADQNVLINKHPSRTSNIFGKKSILELNGDDHKRVRVALVSFLKLVVLKQYVTKVDEEIQNHLETHWHAKNDVQVQPLMKILTFNIICSLLFGIERGPKREQMLPLFQDMLASIVSIPVNLPFTQYNRGFKARKKLVKLLADILREKKEVLEEHKQEANPHRDLITSFLNIGDNESSAVMSDEEIIDNIISVMIAGYDTTSVLLTLLVRLLAKNESIYSNIVQEHEEISKSKASGEALTWDDLNKMKYTWRVASEMLRVNSIVNVTMRQAAKDIEYGGHIIPKGWKVMLSVSMTHMDDSIFQNPTIFDPTRFENHTPSPPPFSWLPFGTGPRMCPGMELAKIETLVMIHHLVTTFKWELLNKDESFKRNPMLEFRQGSLVRITPLKRDVI